MPRKTIRRKTQRRRTVRKLKRYHKKGGAATQWPMLPPSDGFKIDAPIPSQNEMVYRK